MRRRRSRFTSDLHYRVSGGDAQHRNSNPNTWQGAVAEIATAPTARLHEIFDRALEPTADWEAGQIAAERNRLQEERRRAGVREEKPPASEPTSTSDPALRPRHTRRELSHAENLGRLYAAKMIGGQLEGKRARLASAVDLVQGDS